MAAGWASLSRSRPSTVRESARDTLRLAAVADTVRDDHRHARSNLEARVPLGFRPRLDRVDELLLAAARRRNVRVSDLGEALHEPAVSVFELFRGMDSLPSHYGKVARCLWGMVDEVFKAADSPADCPAGFQAKSVQVADIYAAPPAVTSRNAFLVLWFAQDEPVLVPCPELPAVLIDPKGADLADTRDALRGVVWEMTERLNVIAPAARALAARRESGEG